MQEAQAHLLVMVDVLRDLDVQHKGGHTAAADMAYLYAMTQVWFTVERNYKVGHCPSRDVRVCDCVKAEGTVGLSSYQFNMSSLGSLLVLCPACSLLCAI